MKYEELEKLSDNLCNIAEKTDCKFLIIVCSDRQRCCSSNMEVEGITEALHELADEIEERGVDFDNAGLVN